MTDVRAFTVGPIQENAYIVRSGPTAKSALLIDPGEESQRLLDAAEALGVEIEAILITHCHFDHVGAVAPIARATGAPVYCPQIEAGVLADITKWTMPGFGPYESWQAEHTLEGGERLTLAGLDVEVVLTPGHSPGHVTYAISSAATAADAGISGAATVADVGISSAGTVADVGISSAGTAADVGISGAGTAADLGISNAATAADVGISGAGTAADLGISNAATAADVGISGASNTSTSTDASSAPAPVLLSGDVLFEGSVGRVDLPGGDWATLERSIGSLMGRFERDTVVWPGHMGVTTLGREWDTNPFLSELRASAIDAAPSYPEGTRQATGS